MNLILHPARVCRQLLLICVSFVIVGAAGSFAPAQNSPFSHVFTINTIDVAAGTSPETALGIALDLSTNAYVLGGFVYSNTINKTMLLTNVSRQPDIFLGKFRNGGGPPLWTRAPVSDYTIANARLGCDVMGNSFIAGNFAGTNLTFDTLGLTNNSSGHLDDIFLAKYDTSGDILLVAQLGGTGEDTLGDMVADTNGDCFLTGAFQSPVFTAGALSLTLRSTTGGDCFVARYGPDGTPIWLAQGINAHGTTVALDTATNCYVAGYVTGPALFNGLSPSNPAGTNFLAKYSGTGTLLWVRGDLVLGQYFKLDHSGNIYTAGTFTNQIQLGSLTLSNSSASTIFVAKYDPSGNVLWATQLPGQGDDGVTGLTLANGTNCWLSGYDASVNAPSNTVALIAEIDPAGNVITSAPEIDPSNVSIASGIASCPRLAGPAIYTCCSYMTNFTFGDESLANGGNQDVFAMWVTAPPPITATTSSTNLVISWPATDTNLVLQTSSDLSNWSGVTNKVVSAGGVNTVSNAITSGMHFFRLKLQ